MSDSSKKTIYMTRIDLKNEASFDSLNDELNTELTFKNRRLDPAILNEKIKHCVIRRSSFNRKSNPYLIRNSKVFEHESSDSSDSNESESMLASYDFVKNKHVKQKQSFSKAKSFDFEKIDTHSEDSCSKKSVTFRVNPDIEDQDEIKSPEIPKKSTSSWSKIKCTSLSEMKVAQENCQLNSNSSKSLVSLLKIENIHEPESAKEEKPLEEEEQELLESLGELNKISTLKLNEMSSNQEDKKRYEINSLIKNKNGFLRRVSSFPARSLSKKPSINPLYDVKSKIEQFEKIKIESSANTSYFVRGKYSRNSSQTSQKNGLMKTKINFQSDKDKNGTQLVKNKIPDLDEICPFVNVKGLKSMFESNNVKKG